MAKTITSYEIDFLYILQPLIIASFYRALPSESARVEYLCQIVKLHPIWEIFRVDLVHSGDTTHLADHSSVITLQARLGWGLGTGLSSTEQGTPDARIANSSEGDGK